MEVPETPADRIEWFQRQVGRELKSRIGASLMEFQSVVDGVSVQSAVLNSAIRARMIIPSICGEWCQLLTAPLSERPGTKKPLFNRAVQSGTRIGDILIGESFLDADTNSPEDLGIGVVTDAVPSESVTDGFWRFINDRAVLDIPLDVDCVWIRSASEVPDMREQSRQYSVQAAEVVSVTEYAEPATGAHS